MSNWIDSYGDLGPLNALLRDGEVQAVLVDAPDRIYVRRRGELEDVAERFRNEAHLMEVIRRLFEPFGCRLDESQPFADIRLPDGSRAHAVIPPISLNGPVLVLRKFAPLPLTIEDLIGFGCFTWEIVEFLRACVRARLNILISGGTSSGKTTILSRVADMIPDGERIVAVQHTDEIALRQKRVVKLEVRPPDLEGRGEITARDLVWNALRMHPDRIVLGEIVFGGEALLLLDAIRRGHEGALMTIHSTGPRDTLSRLEMMITSANPALPLLNVREMMAGALDLIVHQERLHDGTRKILKVTEVSGMQGDTIVTQDIFEFRQTGLENGQIQGYFTATGHVPRFADRLHEEGIDLPPNLFEPR